jgi:hypothetical protein
MITGRNIAVLLKIIALKDRPWTQSSLALALEIPQSEVNNSLRKLIKSRLLFQVRKKTLISISSCEEFFLHGFRYVFPLIKDGKGLGIPTSYAAPIFKNKFPVIEDKPVWIIESGSAEGHGIKPLYDKLPEAIIKTPDDEFYQLLATADALREPRLRERNMAKDVFKKVMADYAKQQHNYCAA